MLIIIIHVQNEQKNCIFQSQIIIIIDYAILCAICFNCKVFQHKIL